MTDDDNETWLAFSEIALNCRLRNALELFRMRKELPAADGLGGGFSATGLPQAEDGDACGEILVKRA